ncbi:hypothetical protein CF065_14360 [Clostridium sporogenes]
MYISIAECFKLDEILKGFEVAYRSYVAEKILQDYNCKEKFEDKIKEIFNAQVTTSVVNSGMYKSKIGNLKKNAHNIYKSLEYINKCMKKKDFENKDVIYVSEVIDIITVFFSTNFFEITKNFDSTNEFLYLSNYYLSCRNNLAHPASSKINRKDAIEVLLYINKIIKILSQKYFWYIPEEEIYNKIKEFNIMNSEEPFEVTNIEEINIDYKKLLQRDKEVGTLWDLVIGKNKYQRRSGSVVVYGYGGIGKTSIILEFINQLRKNKLDKKLQVDIDFLLFFSSKEERLNFSDQSGDYYINPIKKQVENFKDLKSKVYKYLNINNDEEFYSMDKNGIIVIDNFETFTKEDKEQSMSLIRMSSRKIQYIISSRNEERCEDKVYLEGFTEYNNGIEFVESYIKENNLSITLNNNEIKDLLNGSKGNTLILVSSLQRLNQGRVSFENIINELRYVASQNSEIIADFMYKNTFDNAIKELEDKGYNPKKILTVISLYDEEIDLLTISLLTDLTLADVEEVCKFLSVKLILNKRNELYTINEFANKFVFIKFIPIISERLKIQAKINQTKTRLKQSIKNLEESRNGSTLLSEIMNDWKPKTITDRIAIAEVFQFYGRAHGIVNRKHYRNIQQKIEELDNEFRKYELNTSHPYIRYQKARVFHLFLYNKIQYDNIKDIVRDYYEKTILSIEFEYTYIKKTNSFANVLWIYGTFLSKYFYDYEGALNYLKQSQDIFEGLNEKNDNYYKCLAESINVLDRLLRKRYNKEYSAIRNENLEIIKSNCDVECNNKFINWYSHRKSI